MVHCLLLGKLPFDEEACREYLETENVKLSFGINLTEVKTAFENTQLDHVIMGAGLDIEDRLKIIRFIFSNSKSTTVHMKDWNSKRDGMLPFVKGILEGLSN